MQQLLELIKSCNSIEEVASLPSDKLALLPDIIALEKKMDDWYFDSLSGVVEGFNHEEWWEIMKSWTYFRIYYEQEMRKSA